MSPDLVFTVGPALRSHAAATLLPVPRLPLWSAIQLRVCTESVGGWEAFCVFLQYAA